MMILVIGNPLTSEAINVGGILNLAADTLAGPEVIRRTTYWNFNPDDGLRNREEYVAKNGWRASKLLEKLGQGQANK